MNINVYALWVILLLVTTLLLPQPSLAQESVYGDIPFEDIYQAVDRFGEYGPEVQLSAEEILKKHQSAIEAQDRETLVRKYWLTEISPEVLGYFMQFPDNMSAIQALVGPSLVKYSQSYNNPGSLHAIRWWDDREYGSYVYFIIRQQPYSFRWYLLPQGGGTILFDEIGYTDQQACFLTHITHYYSENLHTFSRTSWESHCFPLRPGRTEVFFPREGEPVIK